MTWVKCAVARDGVVWMNRPDLMSVLKAQLYQCHSGKYQVLLP